MTEGQIKQKADNYTESLMCENLHRTMYSNIDFIAGAHSRDEEIESLQKQIVYLSQREQMLFDREVELIAENDQLRNPWISVEDRLPEKWKRIKVQSGTGEACWAWVSKTVFVNADGWDDDPEKAFYDFDSNIWWSEYGDNIENLFGAPEYWMPIPKIK